MESHASSQRIHRSFRIVATRTTLLVPWWGICDGRLHILSIQTSGSRSRNLTIRWCIPLLHVMYACGCTWTDMGECGMIAECAHDGEEGWASGCDVMRQLGEEWPWLLMANGARFRPAGARSVVLWPIRHVDVLLLDDRQPVAAHSRCAGPSLHRSDIHINHRGYSGREFGGF
ncbi:hypothetical protein BD410DRAFT_167951 [Rickenella mellea]|uniref:Uncharacterized protein n=1 Tax=Rickenella mellea TaxID=50990 RepID=A0A4Y7PGZ9_9AGAM|nr:hypothetical protein BD410DRAFT_167951 [Rickenella mellea]